MFIARVRAWTKVAFEPDISIVREIVPVADFLSGAANMEKIKPGFVDPELVGKG